MNNLKITLDPYKSLSTVSLDGKPLSPYSELSNYIKQPFWEYASKLFDSAEREINDQFAATVIAERFETMLLSALQQNSSACISINSEHFSADFKVDKRFTVVASLAKKYGLPYSCEEYRLPVFIDDCVSINNDYLIPRELSKALLCIVKNDNICGIRNAVVLVIDGENCVTKVNDAYYWHTNKQDCLDIIDAMVDRFVKIPFITETAEKLFQNKSITPEDKELLTLAISIEPMLRVSDIDKIEAGSYVELEIQVLPQTAALPPVRVEIEDISIATSEGLKVIAVSPGETTVRLYKSDEIIPFEKKRIVVYKDKTVSKIILNRPEPQMGVGKTQQISIVLEPEDAEDAEYIIWSVDDTSIADVDSNGVVYAKSEGRITVSASTSKIKESAVIDVLPNIRQMTASLTDVKLIKGETTPIEVCYEPQRCFNSNCSWITNDSNVACVETMADGRSYIRTVEPGSCVVTCIAEDGGCSVSCNVEVLDPDKESEKQRKQNEKKKRTIDLVCIIAIPLAIIALATIVALIAGRF